VAGDQLHGNGSDAGSTPIRAALGTHLKELRLRSGKSLREAATLAALSPQFISLVERGRTEIGLSRLIRLADAYDANIADLLAELRGPEVEYVRAADAFVAPRAKGDPKVVYLTSPSWHFQPFRIELQPGAAHHAALATQRSRRGWPRAWPSSSGRASFCRSCCSDRPTSPSSTPARSLTYRKTTARCGRASSGIATRAWCGACAPSRGRAALENRRYDTRDLYSGQVRLYASAGGLRNLLGLPLAGSGEGDGFSRDPEEDDWRESQSPDLRLCSTQPRYATLFHDARHPCVAGVRVDRDHGNLHAGRSAPR